MLVVFVLGLLQNLNLISKTSRRLGVEALYLLLFLCVSFVVEKLGILFIRPSFNPFLVMYHATNECKKYLSQGMV